MTKIILMSFVILSGSACSTFQESHYTNYNTPYGNVVHATGRAADNAALVNTSSNCPSCAVIGSHSAQSPQSVDYRRKQGFVQEITESALRTFSSEVRQEIDQAIRGAFD